MDKGHRADMHRVRRNSSPLKYPCKPLYDWV